MKKTAVLYIREKCRSCSSLLHSRSKLDSRFKVFDTPKTGLQVSVRIRNRRYRSFPRFHPLYASVPPSLRFACRSASLSFVRPFVNRRQCSTWGALNFGILCPRVFIPLRCTHAYTREYAQVPSFSLTLLIETGYSFIRGLCMRSESHSCRLHFKQNAFNNFN